MRITYSAPVICVMCGAQYAGTWTSCRDAQDQYCPCGYVTHGAEFPGFFGGPRYMIPPGAGYRARTPDSPVVIPLGTFIG